MAWDEEALTAAVSGWECMDEPYGPAAGPLSVRLHGGQGYQVVPEGEQDHTQAGGRDDCSEQRR